MAKTFDATHKDLIDGNPSDWVKLAGREIGLPDPLAVEPLDADLSTFSPQADKLFRITGEDESLLHLELQSGWDGSLPHRALLYNVLAETRYSLPVYSTVILLDRRAESSTLTGTLEKKYKNGRKYLYFYYNVIRVWQLSADALLQGGRRDFAVGDADRRSGIGLAGSICQI